MALRRFVLLAMFLAATSGATRAQSIDCANTALNNSEQAVCTTAPLRSLAASMDKHYSRVADGPGVKQSQLEWTKLRDRCNGNLTCLTTAYRERNAYLAKLPVTAKPTATVDSSREPIKHLFLRHAPAQLLASAPTRPATISGATSASAQLDRAAGLAPVQDHSSHSEPLWLLGGLLLATTLLWQMLTNVCGKCPSCHHWFAKVEIDQRNLASDPPKPTTRPRRGLRQRVLANNLAPVESMRGRVGAVRHYNQCRMCLHEWETTTHETN